MLACRTNMLTAYVLVALHPVPLPPCKDGYACSPWERQWRSDPVVDPSDPLADLIPAERLGPGPHMLVITDRKAMTKMEYKSTASCKRARGEVRRQVALPQTQPT
jgi:hypothetical protein